MQSKEVSMQENLLNMAQSGIQYPNLYVVDSQAMPPPLPPKPVLRRRRSATQTLLYVLVILALCGLLVEGCFIYHLYRNTKTTEEVIQHSTPRPNPTVKPPKPMAHLSAGAYSPLETGVMMWDDQGQTVLYKMELEKEKGQLIVQKEGYYSIYSKVCYSEDGIRFTHSVVQATKRYGEMELLRSRTYQSKSHRKLGLSNSYLAGVFHLFKDDAIFVKVSNHTLVRRSDAAENFFGAYMH
ncbi:tumor necrosis factor ligand superfamily member 14 [Chanos chanos]|uniref:Tumor necrosis factor ligand superfamily member 14 n=1 Tax=Chanos chanos TaxID=29144 RepID=A0A6J2WMT1_CHACN|nr:tumor necrosis factor ligand superfamily member 14-like [Chanos chanos]